MIQLNTTPEWKFYECLKCFCNRTIRSKLHICSNSIHPSKCLQHSCDICKIAKVGIFSIYLQAANF
jgi:hypothetical protein